MKLPVNSIKKFCKCNTDIEDIVNIVSTKIGAIEEVIELSVMYEGVYVTQIISKKEHPNADKLGIYQIALDKEENIQVVAGDKKLNVGDKVAYIKPGYTVPSTFNTLEPLKIKTLKVRGVLSNGMLCSERELNIGPDGDRVLVLDSEAPVGVSFADYYELNDIVIDIENKALTNRGDLFGIIGLAREISAAQGLPFSSPQWYTEDTLLYKTEKELLPLEVKNQSANLCPRYVCVSMRNVHVSNSPVWLKSLLIRAGIKPVNNIVDITNYLALLTGQPLHAFDYDKVVKRDPGSNGEANIVVRLAKDGEKIHTLDGDIIQLSSSNLVIADSTNPIALGGVIGGMDTQIDMNTKNIIIESACFDRYIIRKTSMEHGLFTEAVTRYTKGQSPELSLSIIQRAIKLVDELAKGEVASNIIDIYPEPLKSKSISFSTKTLNTVLGTDLNRKEIEDILSHIEYQIVSSQDEDEYITVIPPRFRTDIYIPEDIYEDIARIYGYENIELVLPKRDIKSPKVNSNIQIKETIRNILSNSGCVEIDTYSFTSIETIEKSKQDPNLAFHIKNALSPELSLMRTSLLSSMLEKAQYNIQKNISSLCMYEFNIPHQKKYLNNFLLPKEDWHLCLMFSTKEDIIEGNPYYQVKRYFEKITTKLNTDTLQYKLIADSSQLDLPVWVKNILPSFNHHSAVLIEYTREKKNTVLGVMGEIDSSVKDNFKLPSFTAAFEINLEELKKITKFNKRETRGSKYPAIYQDICFTLPKETKYEDLKNTVLDIVNSKRRVGHIECLDIYSKDKLSKNITLRVTIEHSEKTLTTKEYLKIKERIEERVKKTFV